MFLRKPKTPALEDRISREEALACKPVRCPVVEVEELDDKTVRLCYPLVWKPWFARVASRLGAWDESPRRKKLELDAMGTTAWRLIDGRRSVGEMAKEFAATYELQLREAELSVSAFLKELGKRGLIAMQAGSTNNAQGASKKNLNKGRKRKSRGQ